MPPAIRSEQSRQAIIEAAVGLCAERGFASITIEGIAARAGVGKTTIYRWWPSKAAILIEGVENARDAAAGFPDTGDIRADLVAQTSSVMQLFNTAFGTIWRGLIGAAQSDEDAAEGVTRILRVSIDACVARLAKARDSGQIRADLDLEMAVELLYGPIYHTWLLRTRPLPEAYMETVIATLLPALVPPPDKPAP
ncbi:MULTISPECIES: TetR/AcrR family transcriptional regulator [unclassified Streptomyces]|uniref:TetR/AcrR family transcriptional regulator n=1 Tax=Streptomyces TaxID=1883 RepID=UPI000DC7AF9E|nr:MULTISPECIES: TetR/AcrR family transcriptional regulator [unclassified Streptomyces]AWZ07301.1 TetR family transcriptional regulator [Streptomyces sp. ICC4]AWZ14959.1 TetR family transcriptional regulator [Streptomyces sp. ICC1]